MKSKILLLVVLTAAAGQSQSQGNLPSAIVAPGADSAEAVGEDLQAQQAELVKKTLNPVASLVSVPLQNNWDFGIGPADAMKYTANLQPVLPLMLNPDWKLVVRTIIPFIDAESPIKGGIDYSGLGDIEQGFYLAPRKPVGGWIMGGGLELVYPTATEDALGSGKWSAGPSMLVLRQEHGFTYGVKADHLWSYAGEDHRPGVSTTYLQPFVSFTTKHSTSFGLNAESSYYWQDSQWSVPLNLSITQLLKLGKQPVSIQLGYRYYADGPAGGPDWGLRFSVTFLFPK